MAVLPTPASPIRSGLFFVRLQRISKMRLISVSLPTTGSSSLAPAFLVMSIANSSISKGFSVLLIYDLFGKRIVHLININTHTKHNPDRYTFTLF